MIGTSLLKELSGKIEYVQLDGCDYQHPIEFIDRFRSSIKFSGKLIDLCDHEDMFGENTINARPPYPNSYFQFDDIWDIEGKNKTSVSFLLEFHEYKNAGYDIDINMFMCDLSGKWRKVPAFIEVNRCEGTTASMTIKWSHKDYKQIYIGVGYGSEPKMALVDYVIYCLGSLFFTLYKIANCSVKYVDKHTNEKINKKRENKGKMPLFSFKEVVIDMSDNTEKPISISIGTHASPRVHLRRGHYRRLKSGTATWVKHCVVGDKNSGIVHKDYSVSIH